MECKSGVRGIKKLSDEGTPVEILEGDGNTTMLAHIKIDLNRTLKKRYDHNNIGKNLYSVKNLLYNTYESALNMLLLRMKVTKQEWKKTSEQ